MNYKSIANNPAYKAGIEYGKFINKQIIPQTVKKREFYLYENSVYINDRYIIFNIIEIDRIAKKVTVNISNQGHHTINTFELLDLNGLTYFEYGNPIPEKIYIEDFKRSTCRKNQ